jgi:predicted DNA-binding transcriptional regulator AlpA
LCHYSRGANRIIVNVKDTGDVATMRKDYKAQIAEAANSREPLLKPEEAGDYVGFTEGWLAKLRMRGDGPKFIKLGRKVRYQRNDLDQWIAAGRSASTSDNAA